MPDDVPGPAEEKGGEEGKGAAEPAGSDAEEDGFGPPRIMVGIFNIPETIRTLSGLGVAKTKINPAQGLLMGWQAVVYLAFAAFLAWMIMAYVSVDVSVGLGKFLAFGVFGFSALGLVILYGSNLVTGDYMTGGLAMMTQRSRWREVLWEWTITHAGHWIGGFVIAWMIVIGAAQAGPIGSTMMEVLQDIGTTKVHDLTWEQLFYRGIFANWLIAMGVWGAFRAKDTVGRLLLIGIPVSIFFAIGFEHSIVNHFALSAGIWAGADYTWGEAWFNNLVPVTLGNIIGAMIFQGMVYWYVSGMQVWTGPGRWKKPHGTYRDLAKAVRDTWTLMIFFVAMAPLAAGVLFLYVVEPALGIAAGYGNNDNWIEPVGIMIYLVITALAVKWTMMRRWQWWKVPPE
ncbi:MAG: formate/nitrite transporter family protein [Thaumarchaeota archaeon]|nr:formate/nitrite transporter family protein [Nitrososphaerota archaeon]MDE0266130.1 formate/nitrite transporter family protein [Nitrososphaerota archaeon]